MGIRRKARECALQMLFQHDAVGSSLSEVLETYWQELNSKATGDVKEFATTIVTGTLANIEKIDLLIHRRTENWRISRMAIVDRNLLRLAVYEFLFESTPNTVVINEALEIAKRFSTHESIQFINGILDGIKNDLESVNNQFSEPQALVHNTIN